MGDIIEERLAAAGGQRVERLRPTGGAARIRGGLSVMDFVKLVTVQSYTADGVRALGQGAVTLANAEGLSGHAAAVDLRISRAEAGGPGRA